MYPLVMLSLLLVSPSLTNKCDSSFYKLATFALANGNSDALQRLKRSAEHYNINFKILNLGYSSINEYANGNVCIYLSFILIIANFS